MIKRLLINCLIFSFITNYSQEKTFKCEKVYDAVKLIDEKKFDEAVAILQECEKIDPEDYTYPYEIALAYTYKKDYEKAISQLQKIKNYKSIRADFYQLLGNNYDYLGNSDKAIATYDEGLKRFPNSGKLYLEKGVVYELDKKYNAAINSFEKGMRVDPNYPSNYYRAGKLYMNSDNKLKGLIYGEIFVNLERTTNRTKEISKMLFDTYKSSVKFKNDKEVEVDFCRSFDVIASKPENIKLPYCLIFAGNFALSLGTEKSFTLSSFSKIREQFLLNYLKNDIKKYPNLLIDYHKKMQESKVFNAYNQYLIQMGDEAAFNRWREANKDEYDKFVTWYTTPENELNLDQKNIFITDQIN